ncbi:MAG: iron chelate uptake ABC transporter family permease subunit, partial [Desulfurococcaceae archaeon]
MSEEYSLNIFKRRSFIIIVLTLGLLFLIPVASSIGLRNVTFLDALKILLGVNSPEVDSITLWLRLRRVLVGVIVGGLLGGSGVIAQAVYRNPLASPFTLGISQAAALGVAVALLFGYAGRFYPFFYSISRPY